MSFQPQPNRPFTLLIKPTSADCNLACDYCFYLEKSALYPTLRAHRMSQEVLERLVSSYMATLQPQYSFCWQGGEPTLMGLDFYKEAVRLQQAHGRPGSIVANAFQTNGVLIDAEWARFFEKYHFLLGLSLDGPAELHDHYRRHLSGAPSHDEVLRGLAHLKRAGAEFNILVLVTPVNAGKARQVYEYLRELDVDFMQFIPCVEYDKTGEPLPFTVSAEEWGQFLCEVFDVWREAGDERRVSVRLFDSLLTVMVHNQYNVCHLGRNCCQYLVVEHNGDIYPCDFFVEADLKLGNLMEGEWADFLSSPLYSAFGAQKARWNEACKQCQWLKYCSGDCLKHRFYKDRDSRSLSFLCAGWQRFFAHAIPYLEELAEQLRDEQRL